MRSLINEMQKYQSELKQIEKTKKLVEYYRDKFYVHLFIKQYEKLLTNIKSIAALLEIENIEDAYTIFRKYIETFVIIISIYENKQLVDPYMKHDSYIGSKACGEKKEEIKVFVTGKPEGYLEYGYLESVVDTNDPDFKYTMKTVCKAAKLEEYYKWYRTYNNFVHNNLSSVIIDFKDGKDKLISKCYKSFRYFQTLINFVTND